MKAVEDERKALEEEKKAAEKAPLRPLKWWKAGIFPEFSLEMSEWWLVNVIVTG